MSRPPRQSPAREAVARLPSPARSRRAPAVRPLDRRGPRGRRRRGARVRRRSRDVGLRGADDRRARRRSELARARRAALAPLREEPVKVHGDEVHAAGDVAALRRRSHLRPRLPEHVASRRPARGADSRRAPRRARVARLATRAPDGAHRPAHPPRLPRIWLARALGVPGRSHARTGRRGGGGGADRCAARRGTRAAGPLGPASGRSVDLRAARRRPDPRRRPGRPLGEAGRRRRDPAPHADLRLPRRERPAAPGRRTRTVKSQVEVEVLVRNPVDNPDTWSYIATLHRQQLPLSSTTA